MSQLSPALNRDPLGSMFDFLLEPHMPESALVQFRQGSLDWKRSQLLEAHLSLCPTCQLQMDDLFPQPPAPRRVVCRERRTATPLHAH